MSEKTVETTRAELQRRRRAILETSRLADAEIEALRAAERVPEFEEGAQSEHEQFTLSRLSETQRQEITQIDAALERLGAGEYGVCRDCGGEIDPRRLAALPYALLCTECASHQERTPGAVLTEGR